MERKNAWAKVDEAGMEKIEAFAKNYCAFLDHGKTERECVAQAVKAAQDAGFIDLRQATKEGCRLVPGDRVYVNWMNKSFMSFIVGKEPLEMGMNILGAHIDSPRLDVKQNPLYEEADLAYLDTHYYGGIKKYQWVAQPLALHGVLCKKDGTTVTVAIGEEADDPVFYITDLLPHLAQEQMTKTAAKVIEGEDLNLIIGGMPVKTGDEDKASVTAGVLAILKDRYGVEEEDFLSAELEIVPAGKARDVGFDRSMIASYGHDDRVCAFPSMQAVLDFEGVPTYTACAILTDKEEIGSVGATGMNSRFFENVVAEFADLAGAKGDLALRRVLLNSRMLSSDVSSGFDPNFASAFEKKNTAFLGRGVCFNKYTGSRGKSGSNDANAEYIAQLRRILDDADVSFQTCELGRVDLGGGGTIAYMCAKYGMNVIDAGVAVLSMHAPYEVISKVDLYEAYRCYCTFLRDARPL
ncbi:MAG: aminopeptidase [Clostridia bacterium]|nr:aminopeptidase [Clostridia bacterium]